MLHSLLLYAVSRCLCSFIYSKRVFKEISLIHFDDLQITSLIWKVGRQQKLAVRKPSSYKRVTFLFGPHPLFVTDFSKSLSPPSPHSSLLAGKRDSDAMSLMRNTVWSQRFKTESLNSARKRGTWETTLALEPKREMRAWIGLLHLTLLVVSGLSFLPLEPNDFFLLLFFLGLEEILCVKCL